MSGGVGTPLISAVLEHPLKLQYKVFCSLPQITRCVLMEEILAPGIIRPKIIMADTAGSRGISRNIDDLVTASIYPAEVRLVVDILPLFAEV